MPTHPEVSVIIPVHNNAGTIRDQLDGLAVALLDAPAAEIIVVDNCSTDGSREAVESWVAESQTPVRVVAAAERAGEPYARNVGMAAARADIILYCDGDDIVGPTWIRSLYEGLQHSVYATGPIDTKRLNEPWLADVRGKKIFAELPMLYDRIPFAHGCSMGFRRPLLEEIGGFDEAFLAGCDQEIAIRIWRAGYELSFCEGATVDYRLRADPAGLWRQGLSYGRYRVQVRELLQDELDLRAIRRDNLRRLAWLGWRAPRALRDDEARTRWIWVAAQLAGEARGAIDALRS